MKVEKLRRMRELEPLIVYERKQLKKNTDEYMAIFEEWYAEKGGAGNARAMAFLQIHTRQNRSSIIPLCELIRSARKARKLTLTQAAALAGVSYATMCKYENAEATPKMDKIIVAFPELKGAEEWKLLELV